ncbi:hypothetical protein ACTFIU_002002 [Dictyostelium citrinum]
MQALRRKLKRNRQEPTARARWQQIPLRQGVLRITIRRRNMFLACQNKRTKHVDTTLTARQEYYRIYNTRDFDVSESQKGRRDLKATTVKPKGPIGRFISTEVFRRRVITQALIKFNERKLNIMY